MRASVLLLLAAIAPAHAFFPSKTPGSRVVSARSQQVRQPSARSARAPVMVLAATPALGFCARAVASLPVMYGLMSVNEYMTHRWYQHSEFNTDAKIQAVMRFLMKPFNKPVPKVDGGGHVEHHAETLDDMTLKTDAKWRANKVAKMLDGDVYRGTAFTWPVSAIMTTQMLPSVLPIYRLLGFSLRGAYRSESRCCGLRLALA